MSGTAKKNRFRGFFLYFFQKSVWVSISQIKIYTSSISRIFLPEASHSKNKMNMERTYLNLFRHWFYNSWQNSWKLPMNHCFRYSPLVRLLLYYGCDATAEDDTGHNALHYALKRGSREMVEDIIDALSEPMRLSVICRTVIRRHLRYSHGYGENLKPIVEKFPKDELPKTLKKFLAYQPWILVPFISQDFYVPATLPRIVFSNIQTKKVMLPTTIV